MSVPPKIVKRVSVFRNIPRYSIPQSVQRRLENYVKAHTPPIYRYFVSYFQSNSTEFLDFPRVSLGVRHDAEKKSCKKGKMGARRQRMTARAAACCKQLVCAHTG